METEAANDGAGVTVQPMFTYRMVTLLNLMRRSGTSAYRRLFDLSGTEWRIMVQAAEHAPLTLNALAERVDRDPGQTSRTVKALVGRGLLESKRRPGGPAVVITPTEAGRELHIRLVAFAQERDDWLVDGIPQDELATAARVLDRLAAQAAALLEREKAVGQAD